MNQKTSNLNNVDRIKALIIGVNENNDEIFHYQFSELRKLCEASYIDIHGEICQNLERKNRVTYVGSGKLVEINQTALALEVDTVIFNDELSPTQLKNIADVLSDFEVWDRTMVILDIFKRRAKTKTAILQVEIAELKYSLPRLIGMRKYLSRTAGGGGGGGGARRGLGETKLELDRRHIENRISKAKSELDAITKARTNTRKARLSNDIKTVSLVGYTNVGKSSTINALLTYVSQLYSKNEPLETKDVYVEDMLFATLDTATRSIKLPNNHEFLLTDTVGFVSKLPHHLITSFKSTLEEINESSLILHIIDSSTPFMELQMETTNQVLTELGCDHIKRILIFNKIDLLKNPVIKPLDEESLFISTKTYEGFDTLIQKIDQLLFDSQHLDKFLIPFDKYEIYATLKEKAEVLETSYMEDGILVTANVSSYLHNLYEKYRT